MFGTALEIKGVLSGTVKGEESISFNGVSTDTRNLKAGQLFIALKGHKFDAHNFIQDAIAKGVAGVVIDQEVNFKLNKNVFAIKVADTKKALKQLSIYWRKKQNPIVVGVTGSCGKTTTKEIIHSILEKKGKALKNHANLNNFYGVCQTLLQLNGHKYAVVEMGINNVGEMDDLVSIVQPDLGIVTNVAPVHLEGLKSLKQVYDEKKILLSASKEAIFLNTSDKYLKKFDLADSKLCVTFGKTGRFCYRNVVVKHLGGMVFSVSDKQEGPNWHEIIFPYTGVALPSNITGAVAVGRYFGVGWDEIKEAISKKRLPGLRMEVVKFENSKIILDVYNANPCSVNQALDTFALIEGGNKTVVLGDMKELGSLSRYYHRLLGKRLLRYHFNNIFFLGEEIKEAFLVLKEHKIKNVKFYEKREDLQKDLKKIAAKEGLILMKGSRMMALEKLIFGEPNAL